MADTTKLGGLTVVSSADIADPNSNINTVASSQYNDQTGLGKVPGELYLQENTNGSKHLVTPVDTTPTGEWLNLSDVAPREGYEDLKPTGGHTPNGSAAPATTNIVGIQNV